SRWAYFHDLVPNTFWAKANKNLSAVDIVTLQPDSVAKFLDLIESAIGLVGRMCLPLLLGILVWLIGRRRIGAYGLTVLAPAAIAAIASLILPDDWMGEYRFAYPFYLFAYAVVVQTITEFVACFDGLGPAVESRPLLPGVSRQITHVVVPVALILLV